MKSVSVSVGVQALACLLFAATVQGQIVINEIMYHPATHDAREEYVELLNTSATNVNLSGWTISGGIDFVFPTNITLGPGQYLVVAAHLPTFANIYSSVTNVVGSWVAVSVLNVNGRLLPNFNPVLSNSRNSVNLNNAEGDRIDDVTYADGGDWAVRQLGPNDQGRRGWIWYAPADGFGSSLELQNPNLPNEYGQNWAHSPIDGPTPGQPNMWASGNIAPMVVEVRHAPTIPRSTDPVSITARVIDESAAGLTVTLHHRVDSGSPPPFTPAQMFDDGAHGDASAGDGIYGVILPAMPNDTRVEFYVEASDAQSNVRTWPAPADVDGIPSQEANALFQVDDTTYSTMPPMYKLIMTSAQYNYLGTTFNSFFNSDAQVNATFISIDSTGIERRYLCGVRNRGHGSRQGTPHNYRVNFPEDDRWKQVSGFNLNARQVPFQVVGAALAQKAGAAGNQARFVQLRVNNGTGPGGVPALGLYAGTEDVDSAWAERQYPHNGEGNLYAVVRDITPPNFDYRGEDPNLYRNTYFKQTNTGEDDWQDLIGMLAVLGENQTASFDIDIARQVADLDQWMLHLAVMNLYGNNETGLNTGYNDDYYLYRGDRDPRFVLVYHDLDTILDPQRALNPGDPNIFRATSVPGAGSGQAMNFLMHHPDIEPVYYRIMQNLLNTTFSQAQFDAIVDSICGDIPEADANAATMKAYMNTRRTTVQGVINGQVQPPLQTPRAIIAGEPRSPAWRTTATLSVSGAGLSHYQWRLNSGAWSALIPIATPLNISGLANGSTNTVYVSGRFTNGLQQGVATISRTWIVNTAIPTVRLNEVLARNIDGFPDAIELHNEGPSPVSLTGLRLTDDPANPNKFVFPPATTLASGAYLELYAGDVGFSLEASGEELYLFNASGTTVLDSVVFGPQIAGLSIGRFGNAGAWRLAQPTLGATNVAEPTGPSTGVRINEWLAIGSASNPNDLIELFNIGSLPVDLVGHYLTDNPLGFPAMHRMPELSFIGAGSFLVLTADGDAGPADHVGFQLAAEQGEIGLFSPGVVPIDCISYGPQRLDVSAGRCPDGTGTIRTLATPTPGVANLCPAQPIPPQIINLMPFTNLWRFHQSTNLDGVNWTAAGFNDSFWPTGPALFGTSGGGTPENVRTLVTTGGGRLTYYYRSTFTVPANLAPTSLQFSNIIDDGAVFFINGREVGRYNFAPGVTVTYTTPPTAISGPPGWTRFSISPTNVQPGLNHIAVEVHNGAGSGDTFFGARLDALVVTNNPVTAGVRINEILASNSALTNQSGSTPDLVELYNPSTNAVDLVGMSFSDDIINAPRKWVLPPGTIVPARGYVIFEFDGDQLASATNSGFGLDADADRLYLLTAQTQVLDSVIFGVQIEDYSIGRNPALEWVLTLPTIGATNAAAPLGDFRQVKVNEWMPRPASGPDWFELYNPEPLPVAIGGCHLSDDGNPIKHQIAALSFLGAGTNAWKRFVADLDVGAGAHHVGFRLDNSAEGVSFADPNGGVLHSITYSGPFVGVSEGFLPDAGATRHDFFGTESPGEANYLALADIVINEVLSHTDLPLEDAIELRNVSAVPVNIGGWWLSDSRRALQKCQLPPGFTIPAGGYAVFYEARFNNSDQAALPFGLSSSDGDQVHLSAILGNGALSGYRATADFGAAANGVSFGRYENSFGTIDYPPLSRRTFGKDNALTVQDFRSGTGLSNAYPLVGPIVITEVMYHPPDITGDNILHEFVELHNLTANAVALYDPAHPTNTWRLRDSVDFDFPPGVSIPPGGYILVVAFDPVNDPESLASFQGVYGTNSLLFGPYSDKLENSSDNVELYKPDAPGLSGQVPYIEVDRVRYTDQFPWPPSADGLGHSLQRVSATSYGNEPANWIAAAPTPGPSGAADNDFDGMPNSWEQTHNLNPNNPADATQDPDGDGFTNLQEYRAGTNPRSAQSHLRLQSIASVPDAAMIEFQAAAGITYSILYRTELQTAPWLKLIDIPAQSTPQMLRVFDPSPAPKRFYLLVTPSAP